MVHVDGEIVEFRFHCDDSESVHVAGDFNDWSVRDTPMALVTLDLWKVRLSLAPGAYRYRYYTSRRGWVTDWSAFGVERNPFGGWDSIVHVPAVVRTAVHLTSPTDAQVEPAPADLHLRLRSAGGGAAKGRMATTCLAVAPSTTSRAKSRRPRGGH